MTLYYQSTTKGYVEFLRDENVDNPWDYFKVGERIYGVWKRTGMSPPVDTATETASIP